MLSTAKSPMQLSSFTQYYIRKLLRQYLKEIKYQVVQRADVHRYLSTDLDAILKQRGLTVNEITATIEQIETLVQMHHQLVLEKQHHSESFAQIEEKIFELIGLRLQSFVPTPQLIQIEEKAANQFKFFWAGELRDGIRYNNMLYGAILESRCKYDFNVYQLIATLSKVDIAIVLTTAPTRYTVWVDLQSPAYSSFINQKLDLLEKVVKLNHILYRFKESKIHPAHLTCRTDAVSD